MSTKSNAYLEQSIKKKEQTINNFYPYYKFRNITSIFFRRPKMAIGLNFSPWFLVDLEKVMKNRGTSMNLCLNWLGFHVIPTVFFFLIVGPKIMNRTIGSLHKVKHGQWVKFVSLIRHRSWDIFEKMWTIRSDFLEFCGPLDQDPNVDPL